MKIICIGRNYVAHAQELNNAIPSRPLIFLKPESSILRKGRPFSIPTWSQEIHHEIEVVLRIGRSGKSIPTTQALDYFTELGLGIDFTARDLQAELKAKGHPWERAKAFDDSAVIGEFVSIDCLRASIDNLSFELRNHGTVLQEGNTSNMIFSFAELIAEITTFLTLEEGDLIFTGTPAGVGPVKDGDLLEGFLEGQSLLQLEISNSQ